MVDDITRDHLLRLRSSTTNQYTRSDLLRWVCTQTYLNGRPFSTKGHEYQERIMLDQSQEIAVRKASQTGLSEMSMRMALGLVSMIPNFSLIYTMPTATLASLYTKTRLDPIIHGSPALRSAIRGEIDSSESKQLGPNNFLFVRGSTGSNAAIAVSADMIITDEADFSDPNVVEMTNSRLTHSPWKLKLQLSTPTTPNGPIDLAFQNSRRHFNMVKCHKCRHTFLPSYWNDVKIPGYNNSLKDVNKEVLSRIRYKEAAVVCPKCGGKPSLEHENRVWVCENPTQNLVAAGYQVSPFDAPSFVTVPSLIEVSTKYARSSQFSNFHLGETAIEASSGITDEDLDAIGVDGTGSPYSTHTMGMDLGHQNHIVISGLSSDLKMGIVHMERVPLNQLRARYFELKAQFRVSVVVSDAQPWTDLLMSIAQDDPNLYASFYVSRQGLELFDVKQRDADSTLALGALRQVSVNRNACFDKLFSVIRERQIWVRRTRDWPLFRSHMKDQLRAQATLRSGEFASMWQKSSKGEDHYHHAVLYAWIASQMRGVAAGNSLMPSMGVRTFKIKEAKTQQEMRAQGRVL